MFGKIVGVGVGILMFAWGCASLAGSVSELTEECAKRYEKKKELEGSKAMA